MATETDAARDRVLAARAALGEELETLEASARAAVDIPAKIKRSPAKAAAIAGSAAFLVVGGPKRLFRAGRRAAAGETSPLPKALLPKEVEKTLRKLGDDGEKVRGTLERDFAAYAKKASEDRAAPRAEIATAIARPLLVTGAKAAAKWFLRSDDAGFQARLAQVRERTHRGDEDPGAGDVTPPPTEDLRGAGEARR
ncbi:MAG: hypothetical protein ABI553_03900 [Chloroflexota bacterium]